MKKTVALLVLLPLFACGKKGPVLAPLVRAPQKVEGVALSQRGDKIIVDWKNPVHYTDGTDLVNGLTVEIWVLEQPKTAAAEAPETEKGVDARTMPAPTPGKKTRGKIPAAGRPGTGAAAKETAKEFESKATLAVTLGKDRLPGLLKPTGREAAGFSYPFSITGKKAGAIKLAFAVRVKDSRSRASEFTKPVSIEPQLASLPPTELVVRALEEGVELQWQAPGANTDGSVPAVVAGYNIYKAANLGPSELLNEKPVRELKFLDKEAENGVPLRYSVRATATEAAPYCESEDSAFYEVTAKDVFPPAAPSGVVPVVGRGFIALSWNASGEKDLAGYNVRRREEGGTESLLLTSRSVVENAYQDTSVEHGRRYHYLVSSVDSLGNESPGTEIVVDSLKDIPE